MESRIASTLARLGTCNFLKLGNRNQLHYQHEFIVSSDETVFYCVQQITVNGVQ